MDPPSELSKKQSTETKTASPMSEREAVSEVLAVCVEDESQELQGEGKSSALAFCSAEKCDYYLKVLLERDKPPSLNDSKLELRGRHDYDNYYDINILPDPDKPHIVEITKQETGELGENDLLELENLDFENILKLQDEQGQEKDDHISDTNSKTAITEKWFRISSIILKAGSQYFHECLEISNEQEENVLTLHMKESEEPAFRKLLEFLHGMSSPSATDPLKLFDVANVAEKFDVQIWAKKCKEELINRFKYLKHPEIMRLPLAVVKEILKSDELEVQSEDDVYKFTLEWALRNYPTKHQRHQVMDLELGPLIRFHYMSFEMLVHCSSNYDEFFSLPFIWPVGCAAASAKQTAPERHFVERAYKHKPVMVFEVLQPRRSCAIWFTFTRDECSRLVMSAPIRSMDFSFHDGRFFIQVIMTRAMCFGVSIKMVHRPSYDYFLCLAAVKAKGDREYVGTHSWEFQVSLRDLGVYQNLFDMPLSEFMSDDCPYFDDGKLNLQLQIEAIEALRFHLRMNMLRLLLS